MDSSQVIWGKKIKFPRKARLSETRPVATSGEVNLCCNVLRWKKELILTEIHIGSWVQMHPLLKKKNYNVKNFKIKFVDILQDILYKHKKIVKKKHFL